MKFFIFAGLLGLIYFSSSFSSAVSLQQFTAEGKKGDDTLKYIFLGHTYDYQNPGPWHRLDPRIQDLDLSKYQRIWLGGDISSEATLDLGTMVYLDSVFDLGSPRVQYALGNHDIRNGNIQYYRTITKKKSYNVYSENGVVSICMNSQLNPSQCEDLNSQFQLIKNVCDTIQESSHLVLMMHNCLFYGVPNIPHPSNFAHSNYQYWNANCSSASQTFTTAIYPMLETVKDRGIQVYVMMGDSGVSSKQFHQESTDSIHFYASGIANSKYTDTAVLSQQPLDRVLVFEHVLTTQEMTWSFQDLDSLFNAQ